MITTCKIQQCETELLPRVHLDIQSSMQASWVDLANPHERLTPMWALFVHDERVSNKLRLYKSLHKTMQHPHYWSIVLSSNQNVHIATRLFLSSIWATCNYLQHLLSTGDYFVTSLLYFLKNLGSFCSRDPLLQLFKVLETYLRLLVELLLMTS